jgi:hypothetical protein
MVDEDPLSSHHSLRDQVPVVGSFHDIEVRRRDDRLLIVVKPELEECFLRSMKRLQIKTRLSTNQRAEEIRRVLGIPETSKHATFCTELKKLHEESRARRVPTFITEIEDVIREFLGN